MIRISRETHDYIQDLEGEETQEGKYFILSKTPAMPVNRANRFDGKVYILISPRTYSASTMFAAMAKCYSDAVIIGEETGMPLISNADITRSKLPYSGMNIYTSMSIYYLPCAENMQNGMKEIHNLNEYGKH